MTRFDPEDRAVRRRRERLLDCYLTAYDRGDLDAIDAVLAEAEVDPELDRQLATVNQALYEEAELPVLPDQTAAVSRLIEAHLGAARRVAEGPPPLTVGDVAARLDADRGQDRPLAATDALVNRGLIGRQEEVPTEITTRTLATLIESLGVAASREYWDRFRRAAVLLAMARQPASAALLAARQRSEDPPPYQTGDRPPDEPEPRA